MRYPLAALVAITLPVGAQAADYPARSGSYVTVERTYVTAEPEYFAAPPPRTCGTVPPSGFLLHADPRPRFRGYALCKEGPGALYGYTTIDPSTRRVTQYREVPSYSYW